MVIEMSEKELLYVEDTLGHLEYFMRHLQINKECLTDSKEETILKKIEKKTDSLYKSFYDVLGGFSNGR